MGCEPSHGFCRWRARNWAAASVAAAVPGKVLHLPLALVCRALLVHRQCAGHCWSIETGVDAGTYMWRVPAHRRRAWYRRRGPSSVCRRGVHTCGRSGPLARWPWRRAQHRRRGEASFSVPAPPTSPPASHAHPRNGCAISAATDSSAAELLQQLLRRPPSARHPRAWQPHDRAISLAQLGLARTPRFLRSDENLSIVRLDCASKEMSWLADPDTGTAVEVSATRAHKPATAFCSTTAFSCSHLGESLSTAALIQRATYSQDARADPHWHLDLSIRMLRHTPVLLSTCAAAH
eukprot:351852-Chlamydomonas_euryale.AAC.1